MENIQKKSKTYNLNPEKTEMVKIDTYNSLEAAAWAPKMESSDTVLKSNPANWRGKKKSCQLDKHITSYN